VVIALLPCLLLASTLVSPISRVDALIGCHLQSTSSVVQAPPGVTHEIRVIENFIAVSYRTASPESISDINLTVKVEHFLVI
jgi:hypothetical protein